MRYLAHLNKYIIFIILLNQSNLLFACPDDQYEQCVFGACVCLPKIGGDVGRVSEQIKKETNAQTGGPVLQTWLEGSRSTAVGTSQPIPLHIRQALRGYVEDDVMNRAKFKIGDSGILNLAGLTIAYGDRIYGSTVTAVTLIDVIVFRDAASANDPALWAHELMHVKQFRDWGTRDFSIRYARDSSSVENPAYEAGNNYINWKSAQNNSFPSTPSNINFGFPSGQPMQGCGCWGFNAPQFTQESRCQSGSVQIVPCQGFCQAGGSPYGYICQ